MYHYSGHNHYHTESRNYIERVKIHRNSRNILSILFEEINCSGEKFDKLKKELHGSHRFKNNSHNNAGHDVFSTHS